MNCKINIAFFHNFYVLYNRKDVKNGDGYKKQHTEKIYSDTMDDLGKLLKEGHSGGYLKKMHVFLVSLLNHAMKYHDLGRNVASLVGNFEIETKKRLNYWTLEQFNQFHDMLPNIQQKVFFKLLFYSGARKGEIRALAWDDINFDDEFFIHIKKRTITVL